MAYRHWSNLLSWSDNNVEKLPISDDTTKITWIEGFGLFIVERSLPFRMESQMCGEYVSSHCRKTYDPVEFVTLIDATPNSREGTRALLPLISSFNAHESRKRKAIDMLQSKEA